MSSSSNEDVQREPISETNGKDETKDNDGLPLVSKPIGECKGSADCFRGIVTEIVDGDTIDINNVRPARLAIDSNDILYVTEPDNGRVQMFNTAGQSVGTIAEGQLSFPVGIDVDSSDNVYVAESSASGNPSQVNKFTSSGQFITSWGSLGSNPGQLNQPKGLTIDEDNNVYVADELNNRIQKFDSNGNFITEFGQDRLSHPIDVAVDSQGRVYASDLDEILIYVPTV